MKISLIACMALNRVIGSKGTIPWYIPQDLTYFKDKTMYYPCIMGKNTFLSLKGILKDRLNIVVSRTLTPEEVPEEVLVFKSFEDALRHLIDLNTYSKVYVIGGEQLYRSALPLADEILLTKINKKFKGDTFFPQVPRTFAIQKKKVLCTQGYTLTFLTYSNLHLSFLQYLFNRLKYLF